MRVRGACVQASVKLVEGVDAVKEALQPSICRCAKRRKVPLLMLRVGGCALLIEVLESDSEFSDDFEKSFEMLTAR